MVQYGGETAGRMRPEVEMAEEETSTEEPEAPSEVTLQTYYPAEEDIPDGYAPVYSKDEKGLWKLRSDDGGSASRARGRFKDEIREKSDEIKRLNKRIRDLNAGDPPKQKGATADMSGSEAELATLKHENQKLQRDLEKRKGIETELDGLNRRSWVVENVLPKLRAAGLDDQATTEAINSTLGCMVPGENGAYYFEVDGESLDSVGYTKWECAAHAYRYPKATGVGATTTRGAVGAGGGDRTQKAIRGDTRRWAAFCKEVRAKGLQPMVEISKLPKE